MLRGTMEQENLHQVRTMSTMRARVYKDFRIFVNFHRRSSEIEDNVFLWITPRGFIGVSKYFLDKEKRRGLKVW